MSQLRMTDIGDLQITNNNFEVVSQDTEVRQKILQNLRTFLGEWFLNTLEGVPYFQIIFEKNVAPELIESTFKEAILNTVGVVELIRFDPLDLDAKTRSLNVKFQVRTVNGILEFNEVLQ